MIHNIYTPKTGWIKVDDSAPVENVAPYIGGCPTRQIVHRPLPARRKAKHYRIFIARATRFGAARISCNVGRSYEMKMS